MLNTTTSYIYNAAGEHIFKIKGITFVIDQEDIEIVARFKWHTVNGYAHTWMNIGDKRTSVYMHRLLMGLISKKYDPKKNEVDHKNRNRGDNRKDNLRLVSTSTNGQNRGKIHGTSSRFKGVSFFKSTGLWGSAISKDKKRKHLGSFKSEEDAARAYNNAAIELYGKDASLNELQGDHIRRSVSDRRSNHAT